MRSIEALVVLANLLKFVAVTFSSPCAVLWMLYAAPIAVFGQAGYYAADFIPTREGDYVWTFTGQINDDAVNEKFDTADGKIDSVQGEAALEFPLTPPDAAQQNQTATASRTDAQGARLLALVGIGLGVLGLLGVAGLWFARPRAGRSSTRACRGAKLALGWTGRRRGVAAVALSSEKLLDRARRMSG